MTLRDILLTLPETMPLKEAIIEADRIKKEHDLIMHRECNENYRQNHKEYKNLKNREYYARKKEKLKAQADIF